MKKVKFEFTIPDDFDLNEYNLYEIVKRGVDNWSFMAGVSTFQFDVDWVNGEIPGILLTKKPKNLEK